MDSGNKLYGSVNDLSRRVDILYGSKDGEGKEIQKLYGSVDGKTELTYINLGEIPRPGLVTYYTDSTYTTTATARIVTNQDLSQLSQTSTPGSSVVVDGVTIPSSSIKEVILPTWATEVPPFFLSRCSRLTDVTLQPNITSIGMSFLSNCPIFNGDIDLSNVTRVGVAFLSGCSSFNKSLDTSNLTAFPDFFLQECSSFNQPIATAQATSFGKQFLYDCESFNQRVIISDKVTAVGDYFLYNCYDLTSPVICNAPASVISSSDYVLSVDDDSQPAYTQGVQIGGLYAQEWITKFPTRTTNPYRNLGFASVPVLYGLTVEENDNAEFEIDYGVSVWDLNGTYTSGSVSLSESVSGSAYSQLEAKTSTGLNTYTRSGVVGNTTYSYEVSATNSGSETLSDSVSLVSRPGVFTVSATDIGYTTYNVFEREFSLSLPANGDVYPQILSYRLKKASDSGFGDWVNINTYDSSSAGSVTAIIAFDTESDYTVEFRSATTAGTRIVSYEQSAIATHQGPTGVSFTYEDINTDVQTWLSSFDGYENGNWFISGLSIPKVTITDAGATTDEATLVQYETHITEPDNGYSAVIQYDDVQIMSYTFEKEAIASSVNEGITMARVDARDSLNAYTPFYGGGVYITWAEPTFTSAVTRVSKTGGVRITYSGAYSGLHTSALNHGDDMNSISIEYRVLNYAGEVITDWTSIPSEAMALNRANGVVSDREYSGALTITDMQYLQSIIVETRCGDSFLTLPVESVSLGIWEGGQLLEPANYELEVWDWKTNTFVADISYLVTGDLNITWELNDVEEVDFSLDLTQFEKKCKEMGIDSKELLVPYAHDIRIRRNGKYILGVQVVEANIQIPNNSPALINVKCTGFLNLLKDQYILDEAWSGYTYAQIARKLVQAAQKPDCLIKNPTGDIDTSYWLAASGTVSYSPNSHEGAGCIRGSRSGTGWITIGTQMTVASGKNITVDVWIKGQNGVRCQLRERRHVTDGGTQKVICNFILDGNWQHIQVPYTTFYKDGYIIIEMSRTDSSTSLFVDDCYVYAQDDDAILCDLKIPLGEDTASNTQDSTRQVSYSLQNIKDALMDLTDGEDDNFDFDFSYDRTFNCYAQKGEEKPNVEITYPGNVESLNIGRSASNLANKVYNIGSGIGDERLQVGITNIPSREKYGTRESIITNSNVELESTLTTQAVSELYGRKDPTDLPTVTIRDGSVNPEVVQVGDYVPISIQSDDYLTTVNGTYRVVKIDLTVDEEAVETMKMTFEPAEKKPTKRMVRYIRDSLVGCSKDRSKQWNEIQALVLVGNEYRNVAQGATVYGSSSFTSDHGGEKVTDGNANSYANMSASNHRRAITIDLGDEYPVDYINVKHYWQDGRTMYGEHLSVGTELPDGVNGISDLETLLWGYGNTEGYPENSNGKTSGWLQEKNITQEKVDSKMTMVRYIRESHRGTSENNNSLFGEFEALLKMNGTYEDALKTRVKTFCSDRMATGNGMQAPVDNDTGTFIGSGTEAPQKRRSVTIDLGGLYPIDLVKFYFHPTSTRVNYGSRLSAGAELPGEANGTEDLEILLWADEDNAGQIETSIGRQSGSIQALDLGTRVENPKTIRYIKDTQLGRNIDGSGQKQWYYIEAYVYDKEAKTLRDVAMGITPTGTATVENAIDATNDFDITHANINDAGQQSLIIDLGKEYPVDFIRVRHGEADWTIYGSTLSVGNTLTAGNTPLETVLWDDWDRSQMLYYPTDYVEKGTGRWTGWLQSDTPIRQWHSGTKRPIRYIRDCIAGNSVNSTDHWVQIQAYVWRNERWENVALNMPVTASFTPTEGTLDRVTNGNLDSNNYVGYSAQNTPRAVTVDLGVPMYLDWIRVFHYYSDNRTYNSPVLSVSDTLPENDDGNQPLDTIVWDTTYTERNSGAISAWLQGDFN